ncbi:MAG: DUF3516 domain-containing protein [Deltaproteobacteria bacterium]|nr:DUF3516 domain-containing protein [Deltaproteobacteria bacterium]
MSTSDPTPPAEAPLAKLLPGRGRSLEADEILGRFVDYASGLGLTLYAAQEEAILELLDGKHVVLETPTGSGKSLVATALHFKAMAEDRVSFYTAPTKALVNEKFFALCQAFGPDEVGMLTGDASINRDAPIICCTAEILSNLALRVADLDVDYVVMDEFHYYADRERGVAWQIPLIALPETTFLLMSATMGDTGAIEESLREVTGREVARVEGKDRPVPLDFEYRDTFLHDTIADLLAQGRYPIYLVNFTQRACAEQAQNLMSVDVSSKGDKEAIKKALEPVRFDTPYAGELARFVRHGLGVHHAGLLPKYRLLVEKLAQTGLLKVISGTDTLGVGVNIPIRTVLFTQLCKFDGEKTGILSTREFLQIAGRAGRKGFDERGSVVVQAPAHVIENLRLSEKEAKGKKVVKHKPPQKGYAHWDMATFERLRTGKPEPLESRFDVTHGMLLHLLQGAQGAQMRGGGYRRLVEIIRSSHESDYVRRRHLRTAAERFRSLRNAGIVEVVSSNGGSVVEVSAELQRDFSLNQTLSLYLVDTLELVDPDSETYGLDVVTLVESILENPMAVLFRQLDRLKGEKVDALKAAGVEYEERMEELAKLEWPKPLAGFLYETFDAFAEKHPWVGHDNIRPKSVAREMLERYCSFHDYVREYGLQRSEGVLLRYLTDVYKTMVQSVPESFRDEQIDDFLAWLRATLRAVDSSLLDEWERMRSGESATRVEPAAQPLASGAPAADADPRAFAARVRGELHRLLKALAERRYDDALACMGGADWTAERLAAEMAPYWAEHATIDLTPRARHPHNTVLGQAGPRRWEARQKILDPEGEEDWMLDCVVDLEAPRDEDQPLIELLRIGI